MANRCNLSIHVTADMIMLYLNIEPIGPYLLDTIYVYFISRQRGLERGLDPFSSISIVCPTALAKWESKSLMFFVITDSQNYHPTKHRLVSGICILFF